MPERKTLHITTTAGPYGSETPLTVLRLVDTALSKGTTSTSWRTRTRCC